MPRPKLFFSVISKVMVLSSAFATGDFRHTFSNVCIFAAEAQQGTIEFQSDVILKEITFKHKSGKLSCSANSPGSNFGCGDTVAVVMTEHCKNSVLLPTADMHGIAAPGVSRFSFDNSWWYTAIDTERNSPLLHLDVGNTSLKAGKYDFWYNEALTGKTVEDNTGYACYDVEIIGLSKSQDAQTQMDLNLSNQIIALEGAQQQFHADVSSQINAASLSILIAATVVSCLMTTVIAAFLAIGRNVSPRRAGWFTDKHQNLCEPFLTGSVEPEWLHPLLARLEQIFVGVHNNPVQTICKPGFDNFVATEEHISDSSSFVLVHSKELAAGIQESTDQELASDEVSSCLMFKNVGLPQDQNRCFLPGTRFCTVNMDHQHRARSRSSLPIEELKLHMHVCDAFDSFTQVHSIAVRSCEECDTVELIVGHGIPTLTTTATHRIVTHIAKRSCETKPAGQLRVGDTILCSGGLQVLQAVNVSRRKDIDIYEVTFKPDTPVMAFDETVQTQTILSKGMKNTRRGGRSGGRADMISYPDTEYDWREHPH